MKRHASNTKSLMVVTALLGVSGLILACAAGPGGSDYKNTPPEVWISAGPPEGGVSSYRIDFEWGGSDLDGSVAHFEYSIADNNGAFDPADTTGADKWTRTGKAGGTFVFSADQLADTTADGLVEEFHRSHTFFVRAVDDDGAPSARAAHRSFTARTLSPSVEVVVPPRAGLTPVTVGSIFTVRFVADDYIDDLSTRQDPEAVSWIVEPVARHGNRWEETIAYIRALPVDAPEWGQWEPYEVNDEEEMVWISPPTEPGYHVFAIRARDEAGAITPVFDEALNLRRLVVGLGGPPILTVHNPFLGSIVTAVCPSPLTITDMPAGVPLEFDIAAKARYGSAAGYRYGWDIADLNDWEVDWTPFPPRAQGEPATARSSTRRFYFGTHVLRVEVIDLSGFVTCLEIKVNIVQFPMSRSLLLVDDFAESDNAGWNHPDGRGVEPDDTEHDQFWIDVTSEISGFNPDVDVVDIAELGGAGIPLAKLLDYRSIIWSVRSDKSQVDDFAALHDYIKFESGTDPTMPGGKVYPDPLALYMAAGGHVLICGRHPASNVLSRVTLPAGPRYPLIFEYELDQRRPPDFTRPTGGESFGYRELCIETLDYALLEAADSRDASTLPCPVDGARAIPPDLRTGTMRAAIPLHGAFPRLELRPETSSPGKAHDPAVRGLDAELYNVRYFFDICQAVAGARACFEPIYGMECINDQEAVYGEPVAFWSSVYFDRIAEAPGAIPARSAVFGFAPVLFRPDQVGPALDEILFGEWQLPRN